MSNLFFKFQFISVNQRDSKRTSTEHALCFGAREPQLSLSCAQYCAPRATHPLCTVSPR